MSRPPLVYDFEEWATIAKASREFNLSRQYIDRLSRAGRVRSMKIKNRRYIYLPDLEMRHAQP